MDGAEVEDGVEGGIWLIDRASVTDGQADTVTGARQSGAGALDHVGIQVERDHRRGAEPVDDDVDPHATAAADLQHPSTGNLAAEALEHARLVAALDAGPQRVVHQRLLHGVEFHRPRPRTFREPTAIIGPCK